MKEVGRLAYRFSGDCWSLLQALTSRERGQSAPEENWASLTPKHGWSSSWYPVTAELLAMSRQADCQWEASPRPARSATVWQWGEDNPAWKSCHKLETEGWPSVEAWNNHSRWWMTFRLRTGHYHLLSHLYRWNLSHTNKCPCGTGSQTGEHILQDWPADQHIRQQAWPGEVELQRKLWGSAAAWRKTADFSLRTGLIIWAGLGDTEEQGSW